MHLVKWLRKNNTKIMAVVVVVLMVGFVGGTYIQQFAHRSSSPTETVAYYGQEKKINHNDLLQANQELEVLKAMQAEAILRSQDLRSLMLGELIFPEHNVSIELIGQMQEMIKNSGYRVTERQINDIYRGTMSAATYWLLLEKEAQQAGFMTSSEESGQTLASIVPQLAKGATYQQLINAMMSRQGIAEDDVLSAFGNLLAVIKYARTTCADENLTTNQIMHEVSRGEEKLNISFVRVDASLFAKQSPEPSQQQIEEQFNKYKAIFAGDVNDSNPYGLGYKQPPRVQLEYLAVKLDDVAKIIPPVSNQEMEDYYQKHIDQFTVSYRSDPNDPNSPTIKKPRSYGEVAGLIGKMLSREQVNTKAEGLIHQAKELIEAKLQSADVEIAKLTSEQFKQLSGDYEAAAKQTGEKNNIKIYAGKTGLLSAANIQTDEVLRASYVSAYKFNPVPLVKVVFAVGELGVSELGPFDPPKPKLYEDIGPVSNIGKKVMMLVRVIDTAKASVPENINLTFGTAAPELNFDANKPAEKDYSVKKAVTEDLKTLSAMNVAKSKAEELIAAAKKDGWDSAVQKFSKLYPPANAKESDAIKLQNLTDVQRLSKSMLRTLAAEDAGDPTAMILLHQARQQYLLLEQLYSLIPADSNALANLPAVTEFKPNMSYFCLKDLSIKRLNMSEYEKLKAKAVYREDFAQSQAMAAVHFNPENIVKRMNFKWTKKEMPMLRPEPSLPVGGGDY